MYTGGMTAVFASPPEPGTKPQYPFAEWLNGRKWVLVRGRDFWGDPAVLVRSIEASARARRLTVEIKIDGGLMAVQAVSSGQDHP